MSYYDDQAVPFIERTLKVDMSPFYTLFLEHLAPGARILDAGCGPGRDAKEFSRRGFSVEAFDASPTMVKFAQDYAKVPVRLMAFQDFSWDGQFDAIWAYASLLHVPYDEVDGAMNRLICALRPCGGAFFCSMKYGAGRVDADGRSFWNYDEPRMADLMERHGLLYDKIWRTADSRQIVWVSSLAYYSPQAGLLSE